MKTFDEFWPYYVAQHLNPMNRALHFTGTNLGLLMAAFAVVMRKPSLAACGLVQAYAFAWVGHFVFERNRPATFQYPWLSFKGDFRMLGLMWTGGMAAEIQRLAPELKRLREDS